MAEPRPRILVVDDEPDIVDGMKEFLEGSLHVDVATARSGPEALAILQNAPVDLVLSDYKMPGMDGMELLARAQAAHPETVRIMMTAFADMDLAIQALNEARILHFFAKPIDPGHLAEVLRVILQAQVATRQRDEALRRSVEEMRRRKR